MKRVVIGAVAAALALSLSTAAALAAVVRFDGVDYTLSTRTGTFNALDSSTITDGSRLQAQVWWGNVGAALAVAQALPVGTLVAYRVIDAFSVPGRDRRVIAVCGNFPTLSVACGLFFTDEVFNFAVASPVSPIPLPAGAPLVLTGLGAIAALRVRKRRQPR